MRFNQKVVIVTGGSRGIGYATVKAFLGEGAAVILCASRQASADKAVAQLKREYPSAKVEGIYPDLSSLSQINEAFDAVAERYGRIDILVNNAGVSDRTCLDAYSEDLFDHVMDLNVKGVFNCSQAVSKWMTAQGTGVILNTSSMVGHYGQAIGVAYPASKSAVDGITRSLARELGPKGIRVNAVAPGIIETDMMKEVPEDVLAPLTAEIPLRRLGKPEDIASAYLFLASDDASYITGVILSVDGMIRG